MKMSPRRGGTGFFDESRDDEWRLPPWVRQTVKALFAVRGKKLDRQNDYSASWSQLVKQKRALVETNPPRNSQLKLIAADERWGRHNYCPSVFPILPSDR
jgi:hypothetical protein